MKKINANWLKDNWRWILCFSLLLISILSVILHFATMDNDLKNYDLRNQIEEQLKKEMKEIVSPPKTAINNFQMGGKRFHIYIETRYRTELNQKEFVNYFLSRVGEKRLDLLRQRKW